MTVSANKPNTLFWVLSVLALLWNIIGVYAYLAQVNMTDEVIATLPQPQQDYYNGVAPWAMRAYATAVFTGLLGCILLLFRKKYATTLFIISLIAVIAQASYNSFIQEFMPIENSHLIMAGVIILIGVLLIIFSINATKKGYLKS
jgi:hypothetical protein